MSQPDHRSFTPGMVRRQIFLSVALVAGATGVTTAAGKLYWSEAACFEICVSALWRSELDGTSAAPVTDESPALIIGVALDTVNGRVYWSEDGLKTGEFILRGDEDGCEVVTSIFAPGQMQIDHGSAKLYLQDSSSILRMNLDGSGKEVFFAGDEFALDESGGKVYLIDVAADRATYQIIKVNLDGSGAEVIHSGLKQLKQLAIDPSGGKLYFAEQFPPLLRRANLDGSGVEDVLPTAANVKDLAIDAGGGKIYWSANSAILRANLDGSGQETIAVSPTGNAMQLALDLADETGVAFIPSPCTPEVPAIRWVGAVIMGLLVMTGSALWHLRSCSAGLPPGHGGNND